MWEHKPKHRPASWRRAAPVAWSCRVQPRAAEHGDARPRAARPRASRTSDVETNPRVEWEPPRGHGHLLSPVTWMPFFPKAGGHQPLLLLQCFYPSAKDPSWQNCSQESGGKENSGCERLNSSFFYLDHGLYFWAEGRCKLSAAVACIYGYLGPFSITTTLMRTQECLHLCQNTLGKPSRVSNFLMRWAPRLLILALSGLRRRVAVTLSRFGRRNANLSRLRLQSMVFASACRRTRQREERSE